MRKIKVALFGLGPIGLSTLDLLARKPWADIVGAVDIDPQKAGRSLRDVTGLDALPDAPVTPSFEDLWRLAKPEVVVHCASSRATDTLLQLRGVIERGLAVVSSCEELLYPPPPAPPPPPQTDALCRHTGARIVGTGVNPGFVLDVLPLCLTGVCREVRSISGRRVVDAATRRQPLQKKIGSGMDPDEFRRLWREGRAGHAGFQESVKLAAHALGWHLGPLTETCEPIVADEPIRTAYFDVKPGQVRGLHQTVRGDTANGRFIELDLKMYLAAPDPHDSVRVDGNPPLELMLVGGIAGDAATSAALVNTIPTIFTASPGIRLMTDLPLPCFR